MCAILGGVQLIEMAKRKINKIRGTPHATHGEPIPAEQYVPPPGTRPTDPIPVENWVYWPPFDSPEYLDAPDYRIIDKVPDDKVSPPDVPQGMTEQQIRDAGLQIDLPFEAPMPKSISYRKGAGKKQWIPPPGWGEGLPPIRKLMSGDGGGDAGDESS